ncbi:MAG: hypothetical protein GY835_11405 [bacterium]|nr:hypothetical protein [bacterium]
MAIVHKYLTFHSRALRLIDRGDAHARRLAEEMTELLGELSEPVPGTKLDVRVVDLPLERLRAMERIIADTGLSIPRRVVAIRRLLMGHGNEEGERIKGLAES